MKRPITTPFTTIAFVSALTAQAGPALAGSILTIGVLSSASSQAFSAGVPPHGYAGPTDVAGREQAAAQWMLALLPDDKQSKTFRLHCFVPGEIGQIGANRE